MSEHAQWQLSGKAPEVYERSLVPVIFAPWAAVLLEHAALQPGERVWVFPMEAHIVSARA